MLIDRIYQKVKTFVNTEGRGNVTPAEFNLILHNAIQARNEDYFFQKNRQTNRENRGLVENGLANTVDRLDEKIQHYLEETFINQTGGYYPLPDNYRYIDEIEVVKSFEFEDIYQEYQEWIGTTAGVITVDFENSENPFLGDLAIKVTSAEEAAEITMTRSTNFNPLNYQSIRIGIFLKDVPTAGLTSAIFNLSFKTIDDVLVMTEIPLILQMNLVGEYQLITALIPTNTQISELINETRKVVLTVPEPSGKVIGTLISKLFIDDFKLQGNAKTFNSIEPTKDKKEFNVLKTQAVEDFPIYLKIGNNLIIAPNTQEQLKITYLRKSLFPKWTYTVTSNVEVFNPSANDFVDADIHPSEEDEMVKRVLIGFGINLKEVELQQAVGQETTIEFNQQNAN